MKYLITGGAGFIGSNLAEALLQKGEQVVVLDNFSTGNRHNLSSFKKNTQQFKLIEGDIRDQETCHEACQGVDYVLHQGALGSIPRSIAHPVTTNANNVDGTLNILVAARDANVKRLVFASSSSVYGSNKILPKEESMIVKPISPYAASKYIGEMYCRIFQELYDLKTIALRYFNVFGRRQDPNSAYAAVIPLFVKSLLYDSAPVIFGDGLQSRDFSYIDNVIQANLLACKAPDEACGQVYNIACGERTTVNDLYYKICELLGKKIEPRYESNRKGDVKHSLADISKAKSLLNYNPKYNVFDGLTEAMNWYKDHINEWL